MSVEQLTDAEIKTLVMGEVKLDVDDATLSAVYDLYWTRNAGRTAALRYLYTRRHMIEYVLGQTRNAIDSKVGNDSFKVQQRFQNLQDLLTVTLGAIADEESSRGPGQVSTVRTKSFIPIRDSFQRSGRRC